MRRKGYCPGCVRKRLLTYMGTQRWYCGVCSGKWSSREYKSMFGPSRKDRKR